VALSHRLTGAAQFFKAVIHFRSLHNAAEAAVAAHDRGGYHLASSHKLTMPGGSERSRMRCWEPVLVSK
jgi:hypothetical protein